MIRIALIACLLCGCSFGAGPSDRGWLYWDVCGWEGGVSSDITVMGGNTWRLGCTDPKDQEASPQPPSIEPE